MMMHIIHIQRTVNKKEAPASAKIRLWAKAALQQQTTPVEVTIRLVDKDEMTHLNEAYRRKTGPTNVLSFPAQLPDGIKFAKTPLGDIIICADVVNQEAIAQSKAHDAHWAHMVIHGIFHLLGYDHLKEDEADIMEALEINILSQLGFPNPYHERD